jgi:hypothetical protein
VTKKTVLMQKADATIVGQEKDIFTISGAM